MKTGLISVKKYIPFIRKQIEIFRELFQGFVYVILKAVMTFGMGIIVAKELDLSVTTGWILVMTGSISAMFYVWLDYRHKKTVTHEGNALQTEIDDARKSGLRVWLLYPRTEETATPALYALRNNGYVLTDKEGCLIDAASELHDRPTQRRKIFRLVEIDKNEK